MIDEYVKVAYYSSGINSPYVISTRVEEAKEKDLIGGKEGKSAHRNHMYSLTRLYVLPNATIRVA